MVNAATGRGVHLRWGAATHRGARRVLNEDSYLASASAFFVADGMGGHEAGEVASAMAIDAMRPLSWMEVVPADDLRDRVAVAHADVAGIQAPEGRGAGTTLTGVVVSEQDGRPYWLVANVGDSRTYHLADGALEQVSVDHSEVQELVDAGALTPQEAAHHPRRHVVTRALGATARPDADYWYLPLQAGGRLLVCSDGLTTELDDDRIAEVLLGRPDPQDAADALVADALAAGGRDNITVLVIDAVGVDGSDDADDAATAPRASTPSVSWEDTLPREARATTGGVA
ncbi:PP2C family protein-serine/threonine phosphatase [Luteimicrobium subarcticum]|uniref:Protein phosphatase n=1 Tax=Luteimicrobium subarcticum TaxID=620910 RepID=A0A2M8WVN4_9MICO|nr:protein phosphatase 2C domain-containing protein [Luteimicrobium subarcticum]PJI94985.1 protein phosphatase [Luteimicrobium subarcticum]